MEMPIAAYDYYGELEVSRNASMREILHSFTKLALIHHPDKNSGALSAAVEKLSRIQEAYKVLSNEQSRRDYDSALAFYEASYNSDDEDEDDDDTSADDWEDRDGRCTCGQFHEKDTDVVENPTPLPTRGGRHWGTFENLRQYVDAIEKEDRLRLAALEAERQARKAADLARKEAREAAKKAAEEQSDLVRGQKREDEKRNQQERWARMRAISKDEKLSKCLHSDFCTKVPQRKKFKCLSCGKKGGMVAFECPYCFSFLCQQCVIKFSEQRAKEEISLNTPSVLFPAKKDDDQEEAEEYDDSDSNGGDDDEVEEQDHAQAGAEEDHEDNSFEDGQNSHDFIGKDKGSGAFDIDNAKGLKKKPGKYETNSRIIGTTDGHGKLEKPRTTAQQTQTFIQTEEKEGGNDDFPNPSKSNKISKNHHSSYEISYRTTNSEGDTSSQARAKTTPDSQDTKKRYPNVNHRVTRYTQDEIHPTKQQVIPEKTIENSNSGPKCYGCGGFGHLAKHCTKQYTTTNLPAPHPAHRRVAAQPALFHLIVNDIRVLIRGATLARGITEPLLRQAMDTFGMVTECVVDRRAGIAWACFTEPEAVLRAIAASPVPIAKGSVKITEWRDRIPTEPSGQVTHRF